MRVHLSLGSNLGDRAANLRAAVAGLAGMDGVEVICASHCYQTEPVGVREQPPFLNIALEVETELEPLELLERIQVLEQRLGRTSTFRWGPRSIDIDIVLWGARRVNMERLTLPHAEFRNRAFVLAPLAEIAPSAVDPVTGMTVAELAAQPGAHGRVERKEKLEA